MSNPAIPALLRALATAMHNSTFHIAQAAHHERRGEFDRARIHKVRAREYGQVECSARHDLRKLRFTP